MPDHTLDEAKTILWHISLICTLYLYTAPPRDHVMGAGCSARPCVVKAGGVLPATSLPVMWSPSEVMKSHKKVHSKEKTVSLLLKALHLLWAGGQKSVSAHIAPLI